MRCRAVGCMLVLATAAASLPAGAQEAPSASQPVPSDWSFAVTPYVWAASLKGETDVGHDLPTLHVDASFRDIFKNLDLAAMVIADVHYRQFGAYADMVYTRIGIDVDSNGQAAFDHVDDHTTLFVTTVGGAYRAIDDERGFLDLLAGARVWLVGTDIDVEGGTLDGSSFDADETWVDPVIGFKGQLDVAGGFYATALAHIGGFGAASDLTWDAFAGFGYRFNDLISAVAGYRHMDVDFQRNEFRFDAYLTGPVIGATFRF